MARAGRGGKGSGRRRAPAKHAMPPRRVPPPTAPDPWAQLALIVLGAVLALRLGVNALEPFPVHFLEARHWAFGQAAALGYSSEPPLTAWLVRGATAVLGDTLFALRLASPLAHAATAWLVFLAGRRLWDSRTGFWAAAGYTAAPGVAYSAMMMTVNPIVVLAWAAALYAMVRAGEDEGPLWWAALGALVGVGVLAHYTMAAFALGALGYGVVSARERDWRGTGIAALAALVVAAPNLVWNARHGFVTLLEFSREAGVGADHVHPWDLAVFVAVQVGLIGPVFFAGILVAFANRAFWRDDRGMRLMVWQTAPLVAGTAVMALLGRGHADWAGPAYVGGALMAARWLVLSGGLAALRAQAWVGVAASLALWMLAGLYAGQSEALTRRLDPFRAARLSQPFCALALGAMAEEGASALLSDSPRRLSECMFYGGLGWGQVALWNPDGHARSEHARRAALRPGDDRAFLLAVTEAGSGIAPHFAESREVEAGRLATHIDRWVPFSLRVVRGFRGYRER